MREGKNIERNKTTRGKCKRNLVQK